MREVAKLQKLPTRIRALVVEVAERHDVVPESLFNRRGPERNTAAKRAIVVLLTRDGFSEPAIGRLLGIHHSTVHRLKGLKLAPLPVVAARIPVPDLSGEWAI